MKRTRAPSEWIERGRIARAAFAVFALLVQTIAPLSVMPPRGQAVHFAHAHQGHADHHADAPPSETPSCPVCYALLAGGQSLEASGPALASAVFAYAPAPPPVAIEAPAPPPLPRARARAPPPAA
jgi:hypothetical protein